MKLSIVATTLAFVATTVAMPTGDDSNPLDVMKVDSLNGVSPLIVLADAQACETTCPKCKVCAFCDWGSACCRSISPNCASADANSTEGLVKRSPAALADSSPIDVLALRSDNRYPADCKPRCDDLTPKCQAECYRLYPGLNCPDYCACSIGHIPYCREKCLFPDCHGLSAEAAWSPTLTTRDMADTEILPVCEACNGQHCWPYVCKSSGQTTSDTTKMPIGEDSQPGDQVYDVALVDNTGDITMICLVCCSGGACHRCNCQQELNPPPKALAARDEPSVDQFIDFCENKCSFCTKRVCFDTCCKNASSIEFETDASKLVIGSKVGAKHIYDSETVFGQEGKESGPNADQTRLCCGDRFCASCP